LNPKNLTQTRVETRTVSRVRRPATLTREEELVLRMRKGWSEGDDHVLEFRGASNVELSARLGLMELHLLADVFDLGPFASGPEVDRDAEDLVVDRLLKVSGEGQ